MSKTVRKQLLGTIKTLKKALGEVESAIFSAQENIVLLKDCGHLVQVVKHRIETLRGKDLRVIAELEKCKELFCVAEQEQEQGHDVSSICRNILQQIDEVEKAFEQDFPDKLEVVFLPYKASMWDSLESVWMAARDDENCEAYVVPIPYYDKNPDETLGEMHYEGELYPDYVPITGFWEYDLELHHPDVIFIHNPYDQFNRITTVAPEYYCAKIRNYTEKLVYIPYFILGQRIYDSFCVTAGTIYSDLVIVQSNKAKEIYVKNLKKFLSQNTGANKYLTNESIERKILPLGIPKIDKVINGKKEEYPLPENWEKLLSGKKAVLYNTGVSGILNGKEEAIKKIEDTLKVFKSREDVVLWWRPHPLSENSFQTLQPQIYARYCEVIKKYKQEGWGIYDDSQELHRALIWTDMYYGDESSLIYLYGVQGKPIIKQDVYVLNDRKNTSVDFNTSVLEKNELWYTARDYNGLFKLDIESDRLEWLGMIPNEQEIEVRLFSNLVKCQNSIWMIPGRAKSLTEYNIEGQAYTQYELKGGVKFSSVFEDTIYMISGDYCKLWKMHTKTNELTVEEIDYNGAIDFKNLPTTSEYYSEDLYLIGDTLYYLILNTNLLVSYDMSKKKTSVVQIGKKENQFGRFLVVNNQFWFIPAYVKGEIICWDKTIKKQLTEKDYPDGFENVWGFTACKYWKGYIWLFPARGNMILKVEPRSMQIEMVKQFNKQYDMENVQIISEETLLYTSSVSATGQIVHIIDEFGNELKKYEVLKPYNFELDTKYIWKRIKEEKYYTEYAYEYNETAEVNVVKILDSFVNEGEDAWSNIREFFINLYANSDGKAGEYIWSSIKE